MRLDVQEALNEVARDSIDGKLHPEDVIDRARHSTSALHEFFTWDDRRAAHRWRMEEARHLIRSYSIVVQQQPTVTARAFVSLKSARPHGGGYLPIQRILSDRDLYKEMLNDALEEIRAVERRYGHLRELQPVFAAARRVHAKQALVEEAPA